jgi:hypothetical protein
MPVGAYLRLGAELEVKGGLSGGAPEVRMLCIEVSGELLVVTVSKKKMLIDCQVSRIIVTND